MNKPTNKEKKRPIVEEVHNKCKGRISMTDWINGVPCPDCGRRINDSGIIMVISLAVV